MARIKEKIRQKISQHLDILIPENRWQQYIDILDRDGIPNRKQLIGVFMILCQQVETLENLIEDLFFQVEMLEKPQQNPVRTVEEDFKLRTPHSVYQELEKSWHPNTTAFYVSVSDWKILEKAVDPEMAKTKPQYGYGKETDPKDGKVKTCLFYKELPIFSTRA